MLLIEFSPNMSNGPHPIGIRQTPKGWQAYVHINGRMRSKRFPPQTALTVMRRWREEQRVRTRIGAELPADEPTLRQDIRHYLQQVQTMPSLRDRRDDLQRWMTVFGPDRIRRTITSQEIRSQLERWRAEGYAASTCNHRRTALMHLWTVLDGKSAPNPVRDVPRYRDDSLDAPPRALSAVACNLLLGAMGPSLTRARLRLFAWTGWPPAQIMRLTPDDIRWDVAAFVRARRKGKGAKGAWLPLLPDAWDALREFKRLGAWGKYSTSSARSAFRRAARAARKRLARAYADRSMDRAEARRVRRELLDVTPYQLRHTFGTLVAGVTRDDRAVKVLMQHSDIRQTHRYTEATADPRASAALAIVAEAIRQK